MKEREGLDLFQHIILKPFNWSQQINSLAHYLVTLFPWACRTHYNVALQNIGVNGVNVTDPTSFEITASNEGVIMDSGSTLAYLIEPAYDQFVAAVRILLSYTSAGILQISESIIDSELCCLGH